MNICIENYTKSFEMLDKIYKLCSESYKKESEQHTRKVEECNPFPEIFLFFYAMLAFFCFSQLVGCSSYWLLHLRLLESNKEKFMEIN